MPTNATAVPSDRADTREAAPTLLRLVYTSQAHRAPTPGDIEELLLTSRLWNQKIGLSGLLIHHQTHFMQCLEGKPDDVFATLSRIQRDPRHRDVAVCFQENITDRAFGSWYMAYAAVGPKTWAMLERVDWRETAAYTYTDDAEAGQLPRGFALLERVWEMYRNTLQADRGPPED